MKKIRTMKHLKNFLYVFGFTSSLIAVAQHNVVPYYGIRSQSANSATRYAGLTQHIHQHKEEGFYGAFSFTPSHYQSFRSEAINKCLFGEKALSTNNCCNTLCIAGSRAFLNGAGDTIENRPAGCLLADYFYLPTDFRSEVTFKPEIKNTILDFDLYGGLDEWYEGLYVRMHIPIVTTKWHLDYCENIIEQGTQAHVEGYFRATPIARNLLLNNFSNYAQGKKPTVSNLQFEELRCAKLCPCPQTRTGVADMRVYLGKNLINRKHGHFGINIQIAAPTGKRPRGIFLFEPMIGNGGHFELGAGVHGHVIFVESEDEQGHLGFYVDANFTHMFTARQKRCFDLKCKGLSRYMLAAKHSNFINRNLRGISATIPPGVASIAQFKNAYAPVANLTHTIVDVSVGIQADISAFLNYTNNGFSWDVGYNLWARSCEKITPNCKHGSRLRREKETWTLKGDAHVIGFLLIEVEEQDFDFLAVNLGISQCPATAFSGTNYVNNVTIEDANNNPGLDNLQLAFGGFEPDFEIGGLNQDTQVFTQTRTSIQPIFLSECDIDFEGAQTRGVTHKLFTHLSYSWSDREDYIPYLGIGASAEFGNSKKCCLDDCVTPKDCCDCPQTTPCGETCCPKCNTCGLSQWGVWVKGGVSF